ncbi:MAG: trigger factor [Patescibacteria group bacterium]
MDAIYSNIKIEKKEQSTLEISGSIAWDNLSSYYKKELERLSKQVEIDGFRKGTAPQEIVEKELGEMRIMQEAAQSALGDAYPSIVLQEKLAIIGYPQIQITKLARGDDLEFKITTAIMPELRLGDYKAIAASKNTEELTAQVTDEEFNQSVEQLRTMYAHSAEGAVDTGKGDPDSMPDVPELSDEFVQKIGNYSDVEDFKTRFREELRDRKLQDARAKRREEIINEIVSQSQFDLPEVLVESEKDKMLAHIKDDITRMGLEYSAWLEHSGKSEEDMRGEMHPDAEARARADIVLKEIARLENISPDEEKVKSQISAIKEVHKDVSEEQIRAYVENIYLNEAVLVFLEGQKKS